MKDRIDINLRIADVALSLNINMEEERLLREAAKEANDAWSIWRKRFSSKSPAEVHAMVTLLYTKSYLALKEQTRRTDELLDSIEQTIDMLLLEDENSGENER